MVTQYRVDMGPLAKPVKTRQGFLIVEGVASRTGVFEYERGDGTIQRELRVDNEVFADPAMSGYQGAPVTKGHPSVPVSARNAKSFAVGSVLEPARKDGDKVRVRMVVQDADAVAALESGRMRSLSTGYTVDFDPTPGVHPVYGRYDGVQRNLVINHLALCEQGRAGPVARVRMDSAGRRVGRRPQSWTVGWRADAGLMVNGMGVAGSMSSYEESSAGVFDAFSAEAAMFTSEDDGHQHVIDPGSQVRDGVGSTSWATSAGAEGGHSHSYIRNADGSYTISANEGHGHTVLPPGAAAETETEESSTGGTTTDSTNTHPRGRTMQTRNNATGQGNGGTRAGGPAPSRGPQPAPQPQPARPGRSPRTDDENRVLLQTATGQIAAANSRAEAAEGKLAEETARADAAEGALEATLLKLQAAESNQRDDDALAERDDEIERLVRKVEDLEAQLAKANAPERVDELVRARTHIERAAGPILGLETMDGISDKDLMVAVVERLQKEPCTGKSLDYIRARFDVAVESRKAGDRALDRLRELVPLERGPRGDKKPAPAASARDRYIASQQNGWKPAADQKGA